MDPVGADALVFVADLAAPVLSDDDRHHLLRVLRLPEGAAVAIADGTGAWRPGRLHASGALEVGGAVVVDPPPEPALHVAVALLKGDKPELVVQKLTELGVDTISFVRAERCVVRWDDAKAAKALARLGRVAREACMQCRRVRPPTVGPLESVAALVARACVAVAERGGVPIGDPARTVLVGPEGGWGDRDRAAFAAAPLVSLGRHVLRAETAAIAAGVQLAALRETNWG